MSSSSISRPSLVTRREGGSHLQGGEVKIVMKRSARVRSLLLVGTRSTKWVNMEWASASLRDGQDAAFVEHNFGKVGRRCEDLAEGLVGLCDLFRFGLAGCCSRAEPGHAWPGRRSCPWGAWRRLPVAAWWKRS